MIIVPNFRIAIAPRFPLYTARVVVAVLFLASLVFTAQPVHAATTLNVTTTADNTVNDPFCSLREAASYTNGAPANTNCGANGGSPYTINIPAGTYNISLDELNIGYNGNITVTYHWRRQGQHDHQSNEHQLSRF